jgi:hypothetical protein
VKLEIEAPPDATPFRSRGRECYLYLGALEMRALQREWGLTRAVSDQAQDWARKQVEFSQRLEGATFEDKIAVLKHGLSRWAKAAGLELTDETAAEVLDGIERTDGKPAGASGRILRIQTLHQQFLADCFGGDVEDDGGPKETSTSSSEPASSTPNGS